MPKSPLLSALLITLQGTRTSIEQFLACFPDDPAQKKAQRVLEQLKTLCAETFADNATLDIPQSHDASDLFLAFQTEAANTPSSPPKTKTTEDNAPFDLFSQTTSSPAAQEDQSTSLFSDWIEPMASPMPPKTDPASPEPSTPEDLLAATDQTQALTGFFAKPQESSLSTKAFLLSLREIMESAELQTLHIPQRLWEEPLSVVWKTCHLSLLRLPSQDMRRWHERLLSVASQYGFQRCEEPQQKWSDFAGQPFSLPSFLSPTGESFSGLQFSNSFVPPTEIGALIGVPSPTKVDLLPWLQAASLALCMLEHDQTLQHALHSAHSFGIIPLDQTQRELFKKHFLLRVRNACAPKDAADQMFSLWELDEAFHSLLHTPFAANKSWWDIFYRNTRDLLFQSKDILEEESGTSISLQELPSEYRSVYEKKLTEKDIAVQDGKPPGKVISTLRVWMNLGGKPSLGRVLYRG